MKHDYLLRRGASAETPSSSIPVRASSPNFPYNRTLHTRHRKWTGKIKKSPKIEPSE